MTFVIEPEEKVAEVVKREESLGRSVANLRYGHLTNPWNSPLSFGIQAFIEFNGLILNNRYQTDKYRITSITGIDSSQIRDSREPIPAEHGEFAYDAFYEGRNIVLNGKIECGSIQVYNWMRSNLLAAFAELVESPLKFNWY